MTNTITPNQIGFARNSMSQDREFFYEFEFFVGITPFTIIWPNRKNKELPEGEMSFSHFLANVLV